ncbi:3'5'-cyclic nucleotide phosphodiesterase [Onchocerca flexuosa]|uniref:3'5'-cyclic nucleotide phosphodiesterase n=1 Tax=Onchocerca flexuosa TaxID=387005 RepID=A0A238C392_9BILA|nr:3'5'-cyclic nucleotide phosphodiesterase [Onchocerca flexuosa]
MKKPRNKSEAILYNDRSVLENHHAAESWRLLSKPENCFIETLDAAETKRFRYLVLEYILATDLKLHFDIIMQFNEKVSDMDLNNESHRVIVSQMLIKFADINSPSKPYPLHRQWTDRICEEFYGQGDEEKRRGMAVSPYMDRNDPEVAKLQDSFISHIVNPLAVALNEAGLLPILPGLKEPELIINLKHNHQKWLHELERNKAMESGIAQPTTSQPSSLSLKSPNFVIPEEVTMLLYSANVCTYSNHEILFANNY